MIESVDCVDGGVGLGVYLSPGRLVFNEEALSVGA